MAFYSQDEYLSEERRRHQNAVRGRTPRLPAGAAHPPEHERRQVQNVLASIPETQPGPNAFAEPPQPEMQQRRKIERRAIPTRDMEPRDERAELPQPATIPQRVNHASESSTQGKLKDSLDTNAKYQAALAKARANPPDALHPAPRSEEPRESDCTTITEFILAAEATAERMRQSDMPSAAGAEKLKLNATPKPSAVPTFRGRGEEQNEQHDYEKSGNTGDRVPVFHPTPKIPAMQSFPQRARTPATALETTGDASKLPAVTPRKRTILQKLKLSTTSRNMQPTNDSPADPADIAHDNMPVKAQAVLGETPKKLRNRLSLGSPTYIPRSASKRGKGLFSRKSGDAVEQLRPLTAGLQTQRPPDTPSTAAGIPQTAISDPTHFSYQQSHVQSNKPSTAAKDQETLQKTPGVSRSRSVNLGFFDGRVPPTPPAKNTPPHERAARDIKEVEEAREAMRLPGSERWRAMEPDDEVAVTKDDRISPTKFGSYGYRDAPKLVTQKSMMSMHASVVPDLMEATTIEEMEARVGGLDLEGFSSPTDDMMRRSNIAGAVYSPSMYSPQPTSRATFGNPAKNPSDSSSNGTIPIVYPGLASDPNYRRDNTGPTTANVSGSPANRGRPYLSVDHGRTHSRDHLDSDQHSLFALHVDQEHRNAMYNSPSNFSHASAKPSPLQYLPATTYSLPDRKGKGRAVVGTHADMIQTTPSHVMRHKSTRGSGLGIQTDSGMTSRAAFAGHGPIHSTGGMSQKKQLYKHMPTYVDRATSPIPANINTKALHQLMTAAMTTGPARSTDNTSASMADSPPRQDSPTLPRGSPQPVYEMPAPTTTVNKQQAAANHGMPIDKVDTIVNVRNRAEGGSTDSRGMRDEARAKTAGLDDRLPATDRLQRAKLSTKPSTVGSSRLLADPFAQSQAMRVSSDVAREFYQGAMKGGEQAGKGAGGVKGRNTTEDAKAGAASNQGAMGVSFDGGIALPAHHSGRKSASAEETETICELKETNAKLMEMCSGFATKLALLEEKVKKGSE